MAKPRSTQAGQYRFKNVDAGKKYKVRINKDGYGAGLAPVVPTKPGESNADVKLTSRKQRPEKQTAHPHVTGVRGRRRFGRESRAPPG